MIERGTLRLVSFPNHLALVFILLCAVAFDISNKKKYIHKLYPSNNCYKVRSKI